MSKSNQVKDDIFSGQHKSAPEMGNQVDNKEEWFRPEPWKQGQVPGVPKGSGFNPVYFAGKTNPFKHAEVTDNFKVFDKGPKK
jgi:hypothetical protein